MSFQKIACLDTSLNPLLRLGNVLEFEINSTTDRMFIYMKQMTMSFTDSSNIIFIVIALSLSVDKNVQNKI